ncbi:hypothetical protein DQ244_03160 [Blastococcus sp. TBT05-19]|uniref:DUF6351 family protein n=1 Tax=Blastococcus sp. TBT05-19 TaxID=2250581 RepID=UPI000DE897C7|nr:DUF6351 family protein [Blastococcus sp. TBT05-19]RBY94340.1 hypothetical protein DQ244_03160 [Blastococcus sp. TBT05-19]
MRRTAAQPASDHRRLALLLSVPLLVAAGALTAPAQATGPTGSSAPAGPLAVPAYSSFDPMDNGEPIQVRTLSSRADLVSGGETFVEIALPAGTDPRKVKVTAGDRDVSKAFRPGGPGLRGLVTDLPLGESTITARAPKHLSAQLVVTNAPQSGPVFSGPQIQPWTCTNGSAEPDCGQPPTVAYFYKSTDPTQGGVSIQLFNGAVPSGLQPYDPANPPADVATTTTDEGETVPFIVREETGYSLRDQYKIAALWDPAQGGAPDPAAANPGFANKLVLTHGQSCDTGYESGSAPDVLFEDALSQGFAVASHALDNAGHNCNLVTQAESLLMTKEMVVERFGPLRFTIGSGCSGGSLVQQQVANAYPGVYQGITPQCSFTDGWSSAQQYVDYVLLRDYLEDPATAAEHGITPAQWPSIFGHANPANQITFTEAIPNSGDPSRECPGVAPEDVYDENTNPDGVRCTLQDYMRNVFGVDEQGFARRPISGVGIQYGLSGLRSFLDPAGADPTRPPLTPEQFVALNVNVGGYDLDFNRTAERTPSDPVANERAYRSGAVNTGAHLDQVAIIDLGGPEPGAFHDVYRKHSMRERLIREHGTADNQVFWEGQTPLLGDVSFVDDSIRAMDEWLAAVEADHRQVSLADKVIAARTTAGVQERCVAADGIDAPLTLCDATVDPTIFSSPRIEAGGGDQAPVNGVGPASVGFTDDRLDCALMPIEEFVYAGKPFAEVFTADQQAALKGAFPTGVCDYADPGKGFQAAQTWLTYQGENGSVVHGGTPLGEPPLSVSSAR